MPTDRNMADINTKPLRGQRIRRLMNLIAYWRSEEQTRVGERERGEREREESNGNWRVMILVITMINIVGFAAMTFAMWKLCKYFEDRY